MSVTLGSSLAYAGYEKSRDWFNELSAWERKGIQTNLILGGFYSGIADGKFGRRTYDAIIAFERQHTFFPNGVLSSREAGRLVRAAKEWASSYEMQDIRDELVGISMPLPQVFKLERKQTEHGSIWSSSSGVFRVEMTSFNASEVTLKQLFEVASRNDVSPGLDYKFIASDFFAIAGETNGLRYYSNFRSQNDRISGFIVTWDQSLGDVGSRIPVYMVAKARYFRPSRDLPPTAASTLFRPSDPGREENAPRNVEPGAVGSTGSGFFVSATGLILTNNHVVEGCKIVNVPGHGRAEVVRTDRDLDLAAILVRRPSDTQTTAQLDAEPVALGSSVIAGGFPLPELLDNNFTVAFGEVTMRRGIAGDPRNFSVSAALQPGNSGGAIINMQGKVVGIASAKLNDAKLIEIAGTTGANFSFAIDAKYAVDFLKPFSVELRPVATPDRQPPTNEELVAGLESYSVQIRCEGR